MSPLVNLQGWVSWEQLRFKKLPNLRSEVFVGANVNEDMTASIQRVGIHLIRWNDCSWINLWSPPPCLSPQFHFWLTIVEEFGSCPYNMIIKVAIIVPIAILQWLSWLVILSQYFLTPHYKMFQTCSFYSGAAPKPSPPQLILRRPALPESMQRCNCNFQHDMMWLEICPSLNQRQYENEKKSVETCKEQLLRRIPRMIMRRGRMRRGEVATFCFQTRRRNTAAVALTITWRKMWAGKVLVNTFIHKEHISWMISQKLAKSNQAKCTNNEARAVGCWRKLGSE